MTIKYYTQSQIDQQASVIGQRLRGITSDLTELVNSSVSKTAPNISSFLAALEEGFNPSSDAPSYDTGLAKDYSGTGWYKATDTGTVFSKDVPEGETITFEGDPIEYVSVWRNDGANPETFDGSAESIEKLIYWYENLHRFATSNVTDMSYWLFGLGYDDVYDELGIPPLDIVSNDISHYDTSNVTNMEGMFSASVFNQPIANFDTSNVTNMKSMFEGVATFNQDISSWDVSNVTSMNNMFAGALTFNQDLTSWDVSNVTDMSSMFYRATSFNSDISNWNVSSVTDMGSIFQDATSFNSDISNWNVSNVEYMYWMFYNATSFNQDISSWDTSNVTYMSFMFEGATSFNQDLSQWCVTKIPSLPEPFDTDATAWTLPKPVWGTCPRGEDALA